LRFISRFLDLFFLLFLRQSFRCYAAERLRLPLTSSFLPWSVVHGSLHLLRGWRWSRVHTLFFPPTIIILFLHHFISRFSRP